MVQSYFFNDVRNDKCATDSSLILIDCHRQFKFHDPADVIYPPYVVFWKMVPEACTQTAILLFVPLL